MSTVSHHLLSFQNYHLVGIKGVAMTSLAQCLVDAGKTVTGCDVAEEFVTKPLLDSLHISISVGFENAVPSGTQCVLYTAAHQGLANPTVQLAQMEGLPLFSYAQAIAELSNQKQGIAVSGVGGKSTVTAMIVWMLEKLAPNQDEKPSFAVGVGDIPGLQRTGAWREGSPQFVIEADEYVADPTSVTRGEPTVPKMLLLQPNTIICTNLKFDHPDVYRDFEHTKQVFGQFFSQLRPNGMLITNGDDPELQELAATTCATRPDISSLACGQTQRASWWYDQYRSHRGSTSATVHHGDEQRMLELRIPGEFNVRNALSALAVVTAQGYDLPSAVAVLKEFRSTKRRFEWIGEKGGVQYYDDYAHHPHEVAATIQAINEWFPDARVFVIFQPHTFSRTKMLFTEFVAAFSQAKDIIFTDIFASAREQFDPTITSDILAAAVSSAYPQASVANLQTNVAVARYLTDTVKPGDVVLTMGAGDVYQLHELLP